MSNVVSVFKKDCIDGLYVEGEGLSQGNKRLSVINQLSKEGISCFTCSISDEIFDILLGKHGYQKAVELWD